VELVVGHGDSSSVLYAHQGLLVSSPFFAEACAQFTDGATRRRIELHQDDEAATASVLEYLYKSDYFPALQGTTNMEYDPTVAQPDNDGVGLLKHARVYTLAQKFGLPRLAALAHKKIHLTQSTAKGEIAYARFVYKETNPEDDSIRKPVAAFWATRSHVLRHEAEHEFKRMCLEFPQFGFDVLSLVLDAQEKRSQRQGESSSTGGTAGRKRQRVRPCDSPSTFRALPTDFLRRRFFRVWGAAMWCNFVCTYGDACGFHRVGGYFSDRDGNVEHRRVFLPERLRWRSYSFVISSPPIDLLFSFLDIIELRDRRPQLPLTPGDFMQPWNNPFKRLSLHISSCWGPNVSSARGRLWPGA
jgi:hypothetical protein